MSNGIFDTTFACDISSCAHSDHRSVELRYTTTSVKRGPSYWKFNDSLLKDNRYVEAMNHMLEDYVLTTQGTEARLRWDLCKVKIKEFTISFSIEKRRNEKERENQLEAELNELEKHISKEPNNTFLLEQRELCKNKLAIFEVQAANSAQIRSRVKFIEQGEKNTKYFLGLEKARANTKIMDRLIKDDGQIITNQNEILQEQARFYSEVYKKKSEFDSNKANDFTRNMNIPTITEESKNLLDSDFTLNELSKSLKSMSNESAPGSDGITYSFLKFFWSKINVLVFTSFESAFEAGELSFTQRQGILTLLHKGKNLARDNLTNWRPISLTNSDYKVFAKSLANRLSSVISDIIAEDQVGFIKGRNISSIIRLIDDTIDYVNNSSQSGILLAVDYRRAFDSISKEYMLFAFKKFGFGDRFLKWVSILLTNTESSINYLGWISESFKVECGVRQGCPFSPLAFIIGLELLAIKIRSNEGIDGLILPIPHMCADIATALKIAMYADDITLFLKDTHDFENALIIIDQFSKISNLYINENKTEAMVIGNRNIGQRFGNIEIKDKLKILGIIFKNDLPASLNEENWTKRINFIKETIAKWSKRNLSISGKLVIVKTYLISQVVFLLQALAMPDKILNTINSLLFRFIWKKKNTNTKAFEKVKRTTMCNSYEKGGLTMINIIDMQNSFLLSWITQLLVNSKNKAYSIPMYFMSKLGPNLICLKSLANQKLFIGIDKIKSHFWKKALLIWNEHKEKIDFMQEPENLIKREQILWNNTKIMFRRKCLMFEDWSHSGINVLSDMIQNGRILTYNEVVQKIGYKASRIFEYNAIYSAMLSANARSIEQKNFTIVELIINKIQTPRQIRHKLSNSDAPPTANAYWNRMFNIQISDHNWIISRVSTSEERLRLLQWKVLHNIYPTRILLHKMGKVDNNLCLDCKVIDYIEHFFCHCLKIKKLWEACANYIYKVIGKNIVLSQKDILTGYKTEAFNDKEVRIINHIILICKMVISKYRYGKAYDIVYTFEFECKLREKSILNYS